MTTPSQRLGHADERRETVAEPLEEEARGPEFQLAPADRGLPAWKLLGAAFVFEALLWGLCQTCPCDLYRILMLGIQGFLSLSASFRIITPNNPSLPAAATSQSWALSPRACLIWELP